MPRMYSLINNLLSVFFSFFRWEVRIAVRGLDNDRSPLILLLADNRFIINLPFANNAEISKTRRTPFINCNPSMLSHQAIEKQQKSHFGVFLISWTREFVNRRWYKKCTKSTQSQREYYDECVGEFENPILNIKMNYGPISRKSEKSTLLSDSEV